jgi:hypothetical protein
VAAVKVYRKRTESGPRFTIAAPSGSRIAKHPGELSALIEAQRDAERGADGDVVRVMDDDVVIYTVRREKKVVTTYAGALA